MHDLIRKRHDGPAWVVVTELANSTGGNVSRHADAAALGIWPSRGYELHGYECKLSRGDVQKELKDPRKADAVGRYCDFWWLVIDDLKIIDGLLIPESWGILVPKNKVLRVHRKAPKLKPKEWPRGFVAALIRNVTSNWVPRSEHQELKELTHQKVLAQLERDRKWKSDEGSLHAKQLQAKIAAFEEASGVEIENWQPGRIGEAVKLVLDARSQLGKDAIAQHIAQIDRSAQQHEHLARTARSAAESLRKVVVEGGELTES